MNYFNTTKIIRDLVHDYINLTEFDLKIIDTIEFQRLKDVRQLTCQQVYPGARHTRFEHSLGVLELMRRAIKSINKNGVFSNGNKIKAKEIINQNLSFNACIAALLHDVGHCPFSHLGEAEFDSESVREALLNAIALHPEISENSKIYKDVKNRGDIGSVHEQVSCILILENYSNSLKDLEKAEDGDELTCDFELIIRSILGVEYVNDDVACGSCNNDDIKVKNLLINLLHSKIFDMDKLDYIMRDSFYTGIGVPKIDTHRLFKNMHLNEDDYTLVFTSKAVPSLQNMIDARDGLYMNVYNHHTVIFSDFLNSYLSRRFTHNTNSFLSIIDPEFDTLDSKEDVLDLFQISRLGLIPKSYIFSVNSIKELSLSDSDWISLLNTIYNSIKISFYCEKDDSIVIERLKQSLYGELESYVDWYNMTFNKSFNIENLDEEKIGDLSKKIANTLEILKSYKNREYLKPWWKTVFEFSNFMNHHFIDDSIREAICSNICNESKKSKKFTAEFRSQIAKLVKFITNKLVEEKRVSFSKINDGEFFVIQRKNNFLQINKIEKLIIYLQASKMIGIVGEENEKSIDIEKKYYGKKLNKIIPQKDYNEFFMKEAFYVFSKSYNNINKTKAIEQIFVFVCTELSKLSTLEFRNLFCSKSLDNERINSFYNKLYTSYKSNYNFTN